MSTRQSGRTQLNASDRQQVLPAYEICNQINTRVTVDKNERIRSSPAKNGVGTIEIRFAIYEIMDEGWPKKSPSAMQKAAPKGGLIMGLR